MARIKKMKHFFIACLASLLVVTTTLAQVSGVTGIMGALDMEITLLEKLADNAAEKNIMGLRLVAEIIKRLTSK